MIENCFLLLPNEINHLNFAQRKLKFLLWIYALIFRKGICVSRVLELNVRTPMQKKKKIQYLKRWFEKEFRCFCVYAAEHDQYSPTTVADTIAIIYFSSYAEHHNAYSQLLCLGIREKSFRNNFSHHYFSYYSFWSIQIARRLVNATFLLR